MLSILNLVSQLLLNMLGHPLIKTPLVIRSFKKEIPRQNNKATFSQVLFPFFHPVFFIYEI